MFLTALSHNQTKHKSLLTLIVRVLEIKSQTKSMPKLESRGLIIKFSLNNQVVWKVTLSSPSLFHPLSPVSVVSVKWCNFIKSQYEMLKLNIQCTRFERNYNSWYVQSNEILLNPSMKCWNWTFNAQGFRVIIVVVQVGAHKRFSTRGNDPTEGLALMAKRFKKTGKTVKN
jgi:hypothetical protein